MFYMLLGTFHIKDVTRYIRDHPYSSVCIGTVSLKGNTYKILGGGDLFMCMAPQYYTGTLQFYGCPYPAC